MGLFKKNYIDSGSGVAKKAPQKKTIFRFFDAFGNKFWTLFLINIIYVLFCIPIVTFGPATAAMTTLMRNIYLEKPQFVFHDFWQAFKKNFKQSLVIGIVDVIAVCLAVFSYFFYTINMDTNDSYWFLYALTMAAEVIFLLMNFFIYPQIIALNLPMGAILKNSLILAFVNLKGNLITLAFYIIYAMLFMFFPPIMAFLVPVLPFAWFGLIGIFACYPAIQKFIINPFYEAKGETNPELPEHEYDESLFEDKGGEEAPITIKTPKNNADGKKTKVIR